MLATPAPVYKVNLGTTDVSSSARTVTVNIFSPTGAVAGTHYTVVGGNVLTIPAGQATTSLDIQGVQGTVYNREKRYPQDHTIPTGHCSFQIL